MRHISKLAEPNVLFTNKDNWLTEYKADKTNGTKKYRYRHSDIKGQLKDETGFKCVYCESKIGHNTPGDVEHIIPSSKNEDMHFEWENMTIACTECNRRKNAHYEQGEEFLNPYTDNDLEVLIEHFGPIVNWRNGHVRAEITVKILELNKSTRIQLILRKIEKIEDTNTLIERYIAEQNPTLKKIHKFQLEQMTLVDAEFSGMVKSLITQKGIL
jgi:uncharacterized protein (TIGR02646 family)